MILIGSRALQLRAPQLMQRKCVDFDFVCTKDEFNQWMEKNSSKVNAKEVYELPEFNKWIVKGSSICEFEIITPSKSSELLVDLVKNDPETIDTSFGLIPSINILFAIKDSHKYKKFDNSMVGFWKTALDWHLMKSVGAEVKPEYEAFTKLRRAEAYAGQKHPSLMQSKDNFFKDDNVVYEFIHDDLHKAVMLNDKPAYEYYIKDGAEVQCDMNKFFECSERIRNCGVFEEACVLGLERSMIAHPGVLTEEQAFRFALAKVCTTITSGRFREYAFNNVFDVLKMYNTHKGFYQKFLHGVESGIVRRTEQGANT